MTKTAYAGIPADINLDMVRKWVEPRNSAKRFAHILGVVDVAKLLAKKAGCDPFLAELGGLLHDACKECKDSELVAMARAGGLKLDPILERNGHLLHGPVAALVARKELGITHAELLAGVAEHTLGAVPMSDLSKVLYLADCLEESRPEDYTGPIWKALDLHGRFDMDAAIVVASDLGIQHLIASSRLIHPLSVQVRNHYLEQVKQRQSGAELKDTGKKTKRNPGKESGR